jgi:hypothetical protein
MLSSLQLRFVKRKLGERVKGKEVGCPYDSERTEKRSGGRGHPTTTPVERVHQRETNAYHKLYGSL